MANAIQNAKLALIAAVPDRPSARQTGRRRRLQAGICLSAFACMAVSAAVFAQTPPETITYTYDALGRLTNVAHAGTVNNGVNAAYTLDAAGNRSNVTVTTTAPPAAPSFAIGNASGTEGAALTFTVTKTGTTSSSYSVNYATADGNAHAGTDYAAASNTLTFGAADTAKTFTVSTINNSVVDGTRTFSVTLSGATGGASITTATGTGTINDDDSTPTPPSFSINSVQATEGGTLVFTVTKTGTTTGTYSVSYASANGTATAGSDYTAVNSSLTFGPSDSTKTISVPTTDDSLVEGNETFTVSLSSPTGGATISNATGTGTIIDNDTAATINLNSGGGTNLRSLANANGYTGTTPATYNFVVPSGTNVTGSAGGGTAIDTGTWPSGVTLTLSINGAVSGGGGTGGAGGSGIATAGTGGSAGGDGVSCNAPISISVSGSLLAGGGGGGGSGGSRDPDLKQPLGGGGGGGGAPNGAGGAGGSATGGSGQAGATGTPGAGGSGGINADGTASGGNGGSPGLAGGVGTASTNNGAGGAAGFAVRKNGTTCTASGNITGTVG